MPLYVCGNKNIPFLDMLDTNDNYYSGGKPRHIA